MTRKELYHKILRIIDYNTCNRFQGPTVSYGSMRVILENKYSEKEVQDTLAVMRKNKDIFQIKRNNRKQLTLRDDEHLIALIEKEASKSDPDKDLIGHINKMRMET